MKEKFKYLFAILLFLISIVRVDAMTVSKNDLTLEKGKGDTVELYANFEQNVTNVEFTLVYTTYDIPANFVVNSNFTDTNPDGIKHTVNFSQTQTGKVLLGTVHITTKVNPNDMLGTINIHSGKATTESGEVISLKRQDINVKIGTPVENDTPSQEESTENNNNNNNNNENKETTKPKEEANKENNNDTKKEEPKNESVKKEETKKEETTENGYNLLEKIESKIVKIEIKENIFDYTVTVNKETLELDLKPIAIKDTSKINITTQKIEEIKDNKILITVKDGEQEQIYTINVRVLKDFEKAEIDNSEFKTNNSYKGKWLVVTIVLIICLIGSLLLIKKR